MPIHWTGWRNQGTLRLTGKEPKSKLSSLDYELPERPGPLMGDALERYWHILLNKRTACNKLAHANVIALREWPVFNLWRRLQGTAQTGYQSIPQIFAQFQWTV